MKKKIIVLTIITMLACTHGAFAAVDKKQAYIANVRAKATTLLLAYKALKSAQFEWNALNYGSTLPNGTGDNTGVTSAEIGTVVFEVTDGLETFLGSNGMSNKLESVSGAGPDQ